MLLLLVVAVLAAALHPLSFLLFLICFRYWQTLLQLRRQQRLWLVKWEAAEQEAALALVPARGKQQQQQQQEEVDSDLLSPKDLRRQQNLIMN